MSKCAEVRSDNWLCRISGSHLACVYELPSSGGKEAVLFVSWKLAKIPSWESAQGLKAPVLCSPQRQGTCCQSANNECKSVHSVAC